MMALMRTIQNHLVLDPKVQVIVVVMNPMMMKRIMIITLMKMKVHPVLMMKKTLNLKVRMKKKMEMRMKIRQTDPYPDLPKAKFRKFLNLKLILFRSKNAIPNSKPKVLLCHFSLDILPGLYLWVQL